MSFVLRVECIQCASEYPASMPMNLCPGCGKPVQMIHDLDRLRACEWYDPSRQDMWRFGGLLPLDIKDPDDKRYIQTLGEGHTPLMDFSDHPSAVQHGFRLQVKEEGRAQPGYGANPTQSFKDRGMAMTVSMAKKLGLQRLVVPTQGNAGDSLAEYGLKAGLEVAIVMPEDTPMPILGKIAAYEKMHRTVRLELVKGTIREAGKLVKEKYVPDGWFSVATFQEPGWRIEGKKTMGLELAEPKGGKSGWKLPDVVIYPTGGGTGILGMWKAFDELEALGKIGATRPRMICVQSASTKPLVDAWESGAMEPTPSDPGQTIAVGLNVAGNVAHFKVLEIIRSSGGCAIAVSDNEIRENLSHLVKTRRWWVSPEGAACVAALPRLADLSMVRRNDHVVLFNTCSTDKYLTSLGDLI